MLLLDRNETDKAIFLLEEVYNFASSNDDMLYMIKSAAILGEIYSMDAKVEIAKSYLLKVAELSTSDPDLMDMAGYEIENSKRLLSKIEF